MVTKADCLDRFDAALDPLRQHFPSLEESLPPPIGTLTPQGKELRYQTPLIEHAILMKLARVISVIGAMRVLVDCGFIHEQGILQRIADETDEDIFFLAFGKQNGLQRIHKEYLKLFWREEFEIGTAPHAYRPRRMVRRQEIREYVSRQVGAGSGQADLVGRFIYGVFSGYVHGASTQIFELLDPSTRRYRISGGVDDDDRQGYLHNALNYPLRALMAGVLTARSLGVAEAAEDLFIRLREYENWMSAHGD